MALPVIRRPFVIPLCVLLAATGFLYGQSVRTRTAPAVVQRVIDGDTIVVTTDRKTAHVRLLYIDTMESRENAKLARDWKKFREQGVYVRKKDLTDLGKMASSRMRGLLTPGKPVMLEMVEGRERDRYRRLLALVSVNGMSVNLDMVRKGYARAYFVGKTPEEHRRIFNAAEQAARQELLGIWKVLAPATGK